MSIFKKVLSVGSGKLTSELNEIVEEINNRESSLEKLTDDEIKSGFLALSDKIDDTPHSIEVEAFAFVREAAKRSIGQRHYDVQLFGGLVLLRNKISEMKTGEGKTLVSTLPISLMALYKKGVHVVTVNEYLAKRDAEWMSPIYNFLGLDVGLIYSNQEYSEKINAYKKDITYGTNNEFGFDYLRDNMAVNSEQLVQGDLFYSVIDEVDSILVDEARTPLIISGKVDDSTKWYSEFTKIVKGMKNDIHYEIDEAKKQVHPTEVGVEFVEARLGITNLYENTQTNFIHYLTACLRAKTIFTKDVDYIVSDGQIKIVDEFTGRVLEGRRYSDGLHQALEAKENVRIQDENQTLASITYQNYFRMYENLAGMTGTAKTEEEEFIQIYNLEVIEIPTNVPIQRMDQQDAVYKTNDAKLNAVIQDIEDRNKKGQPILLGTVSVEASEEVSRKLTSKGIIHNELDDENYLEQKIEELDKQVELEKQEVLDLGGLYVLGTERHDSRRIDNQLRGRSGRQGDPGESRFYISLQDDLMRRFQGERIESIMNKLNLPDEERIEQSMVTKSIERAQSQVESLNFEIRKNVLKFDQVLNQQREVIYKWRRQLLRSESIEDLIVEWFNDVTQVIDVNIESYKRNYETLEQFEQLVSDELSDLLSDTVKKEFLSKLEINDSLDTVDNLHLLFVKNKTQDEENFWKLARGSSLSFIDQAWKDHLSEMDYLRSGIGLRAMGQRDPLVEYQNEGYELFEDLINNVKFSVIRLLMNFDKSLITQSTKKVDKVKTIESSSDKVGRNDPCYCGSGIKYKKCGMVDKCIKKS